jgi:hypothetical protein
MRAITIDVYKTQPHYPGIMACALEMTGYKGDVQ